MLRNVIIKLVHNSAVNLIKDLESTELFHALIDHIRASSTELHLLRQI